MTLFKNKTSTNLTGSEKTDILLSILFKVTISLFIIITFYLKLYEVGAVFALLWASSNIGTSIRRTIQLIKNIPIDKE